ncbi:MAG: hypothetical protein JOY60_15070 [Burkholderiaceae bacterium]|nr:hypothetical protein [Burkholderiaceae bacterium]
MSLIDPDAEGGGDDGDGDFFAPPPFRPEPALLQLKRFLRDLKGLAERGNGYSCQGATVLELSADAAVLNVRLARRLAQSPDWDTLSCRNHADMRRAQDEIKRRLARWTDDE